jgi:type IV pilus assembly protein PilB
MALRRVISKQLGQLLMERGVINQEQLDHALAIQKSQGGLIGAVLVHLGFATEEHIAQSITAQYGFPYLPLDTLDIEPGIVDLIPEQVARQYCVIPIDRIGKSLTIAMANPLNIQAVEDIEMITKCSIQTFVSTETDISAAIERYYDANSASPQA